MDKDKLTFFLAQTTGAPELQHDCPEDELLAAYMEGVLSDVSHGQFENHLADCAWCIERVGMLGRAHESDAQEQVPEPLLARAGKMVNSSGQSASGWRRAHAWAVAAAVVLTIGFMVSKSTLYEGKPHSVSRNNAETSQSTRSIAPGALQTTQPSTGNNISVEFSDGVFSWTPVNDSLFYQVQIVTAEGDLLWRERVNAEQWNPPGELVLSAGEEYFVRIDAFVSETRSVKSDYVAFMFPERR